MPFLDWVNKAQAQRATAEVLYHPPQFQSAHGADGTTYQQTRQMLDTPASLGCA